MIRLLTIIVAFVALAGCQTSPNDPPNVFERIDAHEEGRLTGLLDETAKDFKVAYRAAELEGDTVAMQCYGKVIERLEHWLTTRRELEEMGPESGVITKAQRVRNVRRWWQDPESDVRIACSALFDDVNLSIARLVGGVL